MRETLRGEEWFPAIATLLRYASEYSPPMAYLPPARRSEEEKEQAREEAKRGLELIKAELTKRGVFGNPSKEMP